jgi:hypothetical protein
MHEQGTGEVTRARKNNVSTTGIAARMTAATASEGAYGLALSM